MKLVGTEGFLGDRDEVPHARAHRAFEFGPRMGDRLAHHAGYLFGIRVETLRISGEHPFDDGFAFRKGHFAKRARCDLRIVDTLRRFFERKLRVRIGNVAVDGASNLGHARKVASLAAPCERTSPVARGCGAAAYRGNRRRMKTGHILSMSLGATLIVAAACGSSNTPANGPETDASASAAPSTDASSAPSTTATAVASTPAPTASAVASSAPAAVPATWKDATTKEQQAGYMKANVVPHMAPIFKGQDAKRYADFGCVTCHGPDYKTPKDFLPKLTFKGKDFVVAADKQAILKFMHKVAPEMATAMGDKPFDPATKTGFGCGGCHTIEMK